MPEPKPLLLFAIVLASSSYGYGDQQQNEREQVAAAMQRAATYFTTRVSAHGGYLWRYSSDLSRQEGEGRAARDTVWVQPPGTPAVGQVLLDAHQVTGESLYLEAAVRAGECLVRGQLRSGGWDYRIHFDPSQRKRYAYRVEAAGAKARNTTTLDDDTTQAALRFLIRLDQVLKSKTPSIHGAVEYGLRALQRAQYPNGAWPQRFDQPPDPDQFPVKRAAYPESWRREYPAQDYRTHYTFNDNAIADTIALFFLAAEIYNEPSYRQTAVRGGEFILLAQMPDPQPAWAQQYDIDMHPAWARKFEPPAVTGGESQGVMRILLDLYERTGQRRFLEPIPRAIAYLQASKLEDGRLARFYELKTNRPLYFTRRYELTYLDDDLPTHYGFKVGNRLKSVQQRYDYLRGLTPGQLAALRQAEKPPRLSGSLRTRALAVVERLDAQGRWTEPGKLRTYDNDATKQIIQSQTFVRNMTTLLNYLRAR